MYVRFVSDVDLIAGVHWDERLVQDRVESLNSVLRVAKTITQTAREPTYTAYKDDPHHANFISNEFQSSEL